MTFFLRHSVERDIFGTARPVYTTVHLDAAANTFRRIIILHGIIFICVHFHAIPFAVTTREMSNSENLYKMFVDASAGLSHV